MLAQFIPNRILAYKIVLGKTTSLIFLFGGLRKCVDYTLAVASAPV